VLIGGFTSYYRYLEGDAQAIYREWMPRGKEEGHMKTQSVMTQGTYLFPSTSGSGNTKGYKVSSGFNLMMDSNLKSLQTPISMKGTAADKVAVQRADKNSSFRSDNGNEAVTDTLSGDTDQLRPVKVTEGSSADAVSGVKDESIVSQKQAEEMDQLEDEPAASDELLAQIMTMLQSVQEVVMQQLNLTSEELDQLLSEQGMTLSDLLQPENLQQLILASNGQMDISAVLTDENLAAAMKDLMNTIEEIKADANLGLTEEQLQQILVQANSKDEAADSLLISGLQEEFSKGNAWKEQAIVNTEDESEDGTNNKELSQKLSSESQNNQADTTTSTVAQAREGSANTQDDTSRQNEQRELKAADEFQNFIDNLVKTTQNVQVDFNGNLTQVTELRDIANQILDRIKLSVTSNQASMELQLNPEHLGKVNLTVQSKNGILTAQFVVQNELSKEAIESQLHVLRETLNAQGVKVEAIEVTVSAYAFDQNMNQNAGNGQETEKSNTGKKISLEDAMSMSEELEDSSLISSEAIGLSGTQVNYTV
jgi:flagellar hook-length control protein FliK